LAGTSFQKALIGWKKVESLPLSKLFLYHKGFTFFNVMV